MLRTCPAEALPPACEVCSCGQMRKDNWVLRKVKHERGASWVGGVTTVHGTTGRCRCNTKCKMMGGTKQLLLRRAGCRRLGASSSRGAGTALPSAACSAIEPFLQEEGTVTRTEVT